MIPITALLVALTPAQVRATMVTALIQLGIRADLWNQGGTASTILTVVATTYAGFTTTMVAALSAGFLPTATGAWLVLLAYYVYGVVANPATFGNGLVTLTNTGGGIYTYQPEALILGNAATGAQYTNKGIVTIPAATLAGPSVVQNVPIQATTLGGAGNANPGDISVMVTTAQNVTVTNPASVVGLNAQSDASVRTTCIAKLSALSVRNPRNAYFWAVTTAINTSTNAPVNINRVSVSAPGATYVAGVPLFPPAPGSPGTVTIYAASPAGAPSAGDLLAAGANIEQNVRVEGATVALSAASPVAYTRTFNVWFVSSPGLTAAMIEEDAATALTDLFEIYPIGGLKTDNPTTPQGLYGSIVGGAITGSQDPGVIFLVEDATAPGTPPQDLPLLPGQVATDNITLVARAVASS